ncbi:sensor histidine kinase [Propionibacteriaceae bacterium Y1685]
MPTRPRHLVVDGLLGALVAWLLTIMHRFAQHPPGRRTWTEDGPTFAAVPWQPWIIALAVVVGIAVAVRRVVPRISFMITVVGLGAYLFLGGPLPPALFATVLNVATLAGRRPNREWWIPLVCVVPMVWAGWWPRPWLGLTDPGLYAAVAVGVTAALVPGLIAVNRAERQKAAHQQRTAELRRAAYTERLRMARDIHDVVGHSLSMISLQSGVALHVLDNNPAQVRESLQAIRDASRSSLAELRQTLGVFREEEGEPRTPTARLSDLEALADGVRAVGRDVIIERSGATEAVPAPVQTAAYRIVQEALTNALRHGSAHTVRIRLGSDPDQGLFTVDITDDGAVLDQPPVEGNGLRGVRERVEAIGGRITIAPEPTGGLGLHTEFDISPPRTASTEPDQQEER